MEFCEDPDVKYWEIKALYTSISTGDEEVIKKAVEDITNRTKNDKKQGLDESDSQKLDKKACCQSGHTLFHPRCIPVKRQHSGVHLDATQS